MSGYNDSVHYEGLKWNEECSKKMRLYADLLRKQSIDRVKRETLPYIQTHYGIQWRHTWPVPEDVYIEDIAHALSQLCRFSGHINCFYSVAEHSVRVSHLCDSKDALEGLLHDGSEAYCVDVPRPLKRAPGMEVYRMYEDLTAEAIRQRFNLREEPESVKRVDLRMLATEKRDLFREDSTWAVNKGEYGEPFPEKIVPWTQEEAKRRFLMRFYELTGEDKFYEEFKGKSGKTYTYEH